MEPEPEPVVEEAKKEEDEPSDQYVKDMTSTQEAIRLTAEKQREQTSTVTRLSAPLRPKQMSKMVLTYIHK